MKVSTVLGLKSLISRLHPPLPLNPRESQKLLHLVKSSFRQRLDQQHQSSKETEAANKHISLVLASPLFKDRSTTSTFGSWASQARSLVHSAQEEAEESTTYFEKKVQEGTATLELARYCLRVRLESIRSLPSGEVRRALSKSRAAATILHWLWSSGLDHSIRDKTLHGLIIPFLVAQGKDDVIWYWFRAAHPDPGQIPAAEAANKGIFLRQFVSATIHHGGGLDAAIAVFLEAAKIHEASEHRRYSLSPAGFKLAAFIRNASVSQISGLDPKTYNSYLESVSIWTSRPQFFHALLSLYHPQRPDSSPALQYLRTLKSKDLERLAPKPRLNILRLCLVTAKHLLASSEYQEARWVMDMLQNNFAEIIGSGRTDLLTMEKRVNDFQGELNGVLLDKLLITS